MRIWSITDDYVMNATIRVERAHIRRLLAAQAGNKAAAARALGINRRTLDRKLRA